MNVSAIQARVAALLGMPRHRGDSIVFQSTLYQGILGVMHALYGPNSSQERDLRAYIESLSKRGHPSESSTIQGSIAAIVGALESIKAELESGFLGSLRAGIAAEVLTDLIKLARAALDQPSDGATNVASVLAAAAFEDTVRRLADLHGLSQEEKLADVLTALKVAGVLQGSEVGIAQSFLGFRNKALHANWSEVDRPGVQAVLALTDQLILQHFT